MENRKQIGSFSKAPGSELARNSMQPVRISDIAHPPFIITDSTGIPQLSDRHPNTPKDIDFKYEACPFSNSPSRYPNGAPHEIPMSGLEHERLAANYPGMVAITSVVRSEFLRSRGVDLESKTPLTIGEAKELLMGLSYLPQYLIYRAENPFSPSGEIPPVYIALSNSSSGAHGAVNAQLLAEGETEATLEHIPDADMMIDLVEKEGAMVGEKTVCAASPLQMKHFLNVVVNGPEKDTRNPEIAGVFDLSEVPAIIKFGRGMYLGRALLEDIKSMDGAFVEMVNPIMISGDIPRIKQTVEMFKRHVSLMVSELNTAQLYVDIALGREANKPTTLADLSKILALGMPVVDLKVAEAEARNKGKAHSNASNRRKLLR